MGMKLAFLLAIAGILAAQPVPQFEAKVLATGLRGGYQVQAVDINKDGKLDLLVLASGLEELIWLENPSWERRVIATGMKRMINAAPFDIDKDGVPEIAVASLFENEAKRSVGVVEVLQHQGDPNQPWKKTEIDRLTTSHRLRWYRGMLINAPLTGAKAEAPDYRDGVPLVAYKPGEWKREVIDDKQQGVMHGIFVRPDGVLTASFEGIHLYKPGSNGTWKKEKLTPGSPAAWPKSGSSDVTMVKLKGKQLMAAIEPWHGSEVAVYDKGTRSVIDESLVDGHTIVAADLDGNGNEEIIAGYRGGPAPPAGSPAPRRGVHVYRFMKDGNWHRSILDNDIAAAACIAADLDADKRVDIVCIGSATQNVKWYRQVTPSMRAEGRR
jgi:hypothetical protein